SPSTDLLKHLRSFRRPSLLTDRDSRREEAQHALVEAELPFELLHHRRLGRDLEDRVRPLPLLADVVREPALPPVVDLTDLGAECLELLAELRQQRGDLLVRRPWVDDHQNLVWSQLSHPPELSCAPNGIKHPKPLHRQRRKLDTPRAVAL